MWKSKIPLNFVLLNSYIYTFKISSKLKRWDSKSSAVSYFPKSLKVLVSFESSHKHMFSHVHDIATATIQLSSSNKLYPNILFRASAVAFRVHHLVGFWNVDSLIDLSIFSFDRALLLLSRSLFSVALFTMFSPTMGYSKFNGRITVLFVTNNTLDALTLPSLFGKSSMIFPIFYDPLGTFVFIWTLSPLGSISFASILGNFRFSAISLEDSIDNQ